MLDTFNDERRAFEFFVNPLGVQMDLFQNDVTGNEDDSWDALWASAGRLTATATRSRWRSPSRRCVSPARPATQTWGIDAAAHLAARPAPPHRSQRPAARAQLLPLPESKLTGFEGITPGRNFELDPTLTANQTRARADSDRSPTTKTRTSSPASPRAGA